MSVFRFLKYIMTTYLNIFMFLQTAEFAEPQYVKGVILFTLIEWRQPVSKFVESATVFVVKEDGEKKQCGASISQGEGGIFTPVNMVWCDEIATKVRIVE